MCIGGDSRDSLLRNLLSARDLDASKVFAPQLLFGPSGARVVSEEPVLMDVNRDGVGDAAFVFNTQDTGIACGDTEAELSGYIQNMGRFEVSGLIMTDECEADTCHP